jgi:phage-related protein
MPDAASALIDVNNAAYKIERALFSLHTAVTGDGFKGVLGQLPGIIKDTVLKTLGNILQQVRDVVTQFLDSNIMAAIKGVLDAGRQVVDATMDLLPEAAQKLAETAKRFIAVVVDFANAGIHHIRAIVDMLGKIGAGLAASPNTALEASTTKALQDAGIIPPATP